MLDALAANLRTAGRVALFEIGKVYWPIAWRAAAGRAGACGHRPGRAARGRRLAEPRRRAHGLLRSQGRRRELLDRLGLLGDARFEPASHPLFGPKAARR
jgi:phenylalanyl-tRNA synthetase beta subunit